MCLSLYHHWASHIDQFLIFVKVKHLAGKCKPATERSWKQTQVNAQTESRFNSKNIWKTKIWRLRLEPRHWSIPYLQKPVRKAKLKITGNCTACNECIQTLSSGRCGQCGRSPSWTHTSLNSKYINLRPWPSARREFWCHPCLCTKSNIVAMIFTNNIWAILSKCIIL